MIKFIIGIGIMCVGVGFAATSEYIDGIALILIGACWIDEERMNLELIDLKSEIAELRHASNNVANKHEYLVID